MTLREEFVFLALLRRCKRGLICTKLCDKKVASWWRTPSNFHANIGIVQRVLNVIVIIYKCFCTTNEFRTLDIFCLKTRRFSSFHNLLYIRWLWEINRKTKPWHVRRWCRFSHFMLSFLSFRRLISGKLTCDLRHFAQQWGSFFVKKWGELWFYLCFLSFYSVDDGLAKC